MSRGKQRGSQRQVCQIGCERGAEVDNGRWVLTRSTPEESTGFMLKKRKTEGVGEEERRMSSGLEALLRADPRSKYKSGRHALSSPPFVRHSFNRTRHWDNRNG
jgi:hypothetical protein